MKTLVLLFVLFATPAWAAITFDAGSTTDVGGVDTASFSHTTANQSDRLMVGCAAVRDGATASISTFTYNSEALTAVTTVDNSDNALRMNMYRRIAPTGDGAAHDVEITLAASTDGMVVGVGTYYGVHQTTPLGTAATHQATQGESGGVTVNGVAGDELVTDCWTAQDLGETITVGGGQTTRWQDNRVASFPWASSSTEAGTGSIIMDRTWSATGISFATIGVAIKPATAAAKRRILVVVE